MRECDRRKENTMFRLMFNSVIIYYGRIQCAVKEFTLKECVCVCVWVVCHRKKGPTVLILIIIACMIFLPGGGGGYECCVLCLFVQNVARLPQWLVGSKPNPATAPKMVPMRWVC